jgi:hypothetical protein
MLSPFIRSEGKAAKRQLWQTCTAGKVTDLPTSKPSLVVSAQPIHTIWLQSADVL